MPRSRKTKSKSIERQVSSGDDVIATGSASVSKYSLGTGFDVSLGPSQREIDLENALAAAQSEIARLSRAQLDDYDNKAPNIAIGKIAEDPFVQKNEPSGAFLNPPSLSSLPKVELTAFDGNPVDYWKFIRQFECYVESKTNDPGQRLLYLMYYCQGKARKAIDACVMLPPTDGYERARTILENMFVLPHVVARALLEDLLSEARQVRNNSNGLSNLALQMESCQIALSQMRCKADLNSIATLEGMVKCLPIALQHQWAEFVDKIYCEGYDVTFEHLTEFISRRARIARSRFGQLIENSSTYRGPPRLPSTNELRAPERRRVNVAVSALRSSCCLCNGLHDLPACPEFLRSDVKSRWEIVEWNCLCFVCLQRSHNANDCKHKLWCTTHNCDKRHHKLLHYESPAKTPRENVNCSYAAFSANVCLGYFPVNIETPKGLIKAVAFLDSGSDTTLVRRDFAERYGMPGSPANVSISTLGHCHQLNCSRLGFNILSPDGNEVVQVPTAYTVEKLPEISKHSLKEISERYAHLHDIDCLDVDGSKVDLLFGCNVPEAHWVLEQRIGGRKQPFATRTLLGWIIQGPTDRISKSINFINSCHEKSVDVNEQLSRLYDREFSDLCTEDTGFSRDDEAALRIVEKSTLLDGHFQVPLPWKSSEISLMNNYQLAERRLNLLQRRFERDPQLFKRYVEVLNHHFDAGHIEEVPPTTAQSSRIWYLPHHPVFNPKEPDKCRIVFDCAAKYENVSLNDVLLQGPNLTTHLVDVLLRFRLYRYAFAADIKEMFLQVGVPQEDRDALRLLWWQDSDMTSSIKEYRMTVHPFGATSSPFCATYALRKTAENFGHMFNPEISRYITSNFYVDDCLISFATIDEAKSAMKQLSQLLKLGGFQLTKWLSSDREVLESIPLDERAPSVRSITEDSLPVERTLGLNWHAFQDEFALEFGISHREFTRRGVLSMVSSLYDPLGLISPWILPGKELMQRTCKLKLGWDESLPDELAVLFAKWVKGLHALVEIRVPRWIGVPNESFASVELHIFCDASEVGHGAVAYGCVVNQGRRSPIHLLFSKSRVNPLNAVSIPRLELAAAVLAVRIYLLLKRAIGNYLGDIVFWTDSMIVLHYINNESTRFTTYVANRLTMIHSHTIPKQWRHVGTELNPADLTSRGVVDMIKRDLWLNGPEFLQYPCDRWPKVTISNDVMEQVELKRGTCNAIVSTMEDKLTSMLHRYSDWVRLIRSVAWLTRFKLYMTVMFGKPKDASIVVGSLRVLELRRAEYDIIQLVQKQTFGCQTSVTIDETIPNSLRKLLPSLRNGILHVGGRLQNSPLSDTVKHPIIMPKGHHVTNLIISFYHILEGHAGPMHTLSILRQKYWIVDGLSSVKRVLSKCVRCKRHNVRTSNQLMSSLPAARVNWGGFPFAEVGLDYFGPFSVKRGRSVEKRYGCLFTCMKCRAVHIEVAHSMSTDSFMLAILRFISRRGTPEDIYSDNGSNFVGADKLLQVWVKGIDNSVISTRLSSRGIQWHFNPPYASHRGGVWERLIRIIRKALSGMCLEQTPTDETLLTALTEAERILNNRPLVPLSSDDIDALALCPNDLLLHRSNWRAPDDVGFVERIRMNWKQSLYLAEVFWKRWRREYLPLLQARQKWINTQRNLRKGDIVLVVSEDAHRRTWPLGIVEEAITSHDELVRSVMVRTKNGIIERDIRKICLLEGAQEDVGHLGVGSVPDLGARSGRRVSGSVASRNTTERPTGRRGFGRRTAVSPIRS